MILEQFYLNCLAHASYLIGDEQARVAAVVDPQRDIERYLAFADERGLRITHVFLTHLHADFLAGHLELRDRIGATICLGAAAKAEYAFLALRDGDAIDLGRVRIEALETPGHTRESVSLLVFDLDRSDTHPHAVLTGDTLFVGDVGRPDLHGTFGWSADVAGQHALRFAADQAPGVAGRQPGVPGARCRVAVRQGARQGDVLDHRRAASIELCVAADEPGRHSSSSSRRISPTRRRTSPTTRC